MCAPIAFPSPSSRGRTKIYSSLFVQLPAFCLHRGVFKLTFLATTLFLADYFSERVVSADASHCLISQLELKNIDAGTLSAFVYVQKRYLVVYLGAPCHGFIIGSTAEGICTSRPVPGWTPTPTDFHTYPTLDLLGVLHSRQPVTRIYPLVSASWRLRA